jgi:hypothetical protein
MGSWWHRDVIAAGKLPLGLCFLAFVVTFASTRTITRLIRDGRGPFRNQVTASGTHIHHAVPGLILLIIGALTAVGGPGSLGWLCFAGVCVGIGMSLVLDEFALILHLQDVYWSGEGQLSVEAVSLVAACLGLALVGFSPLRVPDIGGAATAASGWSTPPAGPRTSTAAGNRCWWTGRTSSAAARRCRTRPHRPDKIKILRPNE